MNRLLSLFEGARRRRQTQLVAVAACAVLLGACGGGGGNNDTPVAVAVAPLPTDLIAGSQVPFSASTSSAGAYTFISGIVATGELNNSEPISLGDGELSFATSETEEPDPRV